MKESTIKNITIDSDEIKAALAHWLKVTYEKDIPPGNIMITKKEYHPMSATTTECPYYAKVTEIIE